MDTKEVAQQIIKTAKAEGAEFAEVVVQQSEFSLKRVRQGQVDQPPAGEQWACDLALVKNGRRKAVTFDNPLFAKQIVQETLEHMELLPKSEIAVPTEVFEQVNQPNELYDANTAALADENLIAIARQVQQKIQKHNLFLSGKLTQGRGQVTYENSRGTTQTARFTLAAAGLFAFNQENQSVSAYASSGGTSLATIEIDRLAAELAHKCGLQQGKEKIDLFADKEEDLKIDVIVEPTFFAPIFDWLGFFGFNGLLVERGESFISGKLAQQITGKNITLLDDPADKRNRGLGLPFDFEGRPRRKIALLEKGVAAHALYDSQLASQWNKGPTGNALPPSARSEGAAPFNLVLEGGNASVEEMISSSQEPTLWLTKVHYLAMKHHQTATMTGVAQHGVFLVENGRVQAPVENLRFEENIMEALKRVEAMSPSRLVFDPLSLSLPGGAVVPAMKIKQFRFVGSTKRSV